MAGCLLFGSNLDNFPLNISSYTSQYQPYSSYQPITTTCDLSQTCRGENLNMLLQETHNRSESYCCYVNPLDQTDLKTSASPESTVLDIPNFGKQDQKGAEEEPSADDKKQVQFCLRTYDQSQSSRGSQTNTKPLVSINGSFQHHPSIPLPSTPTNVVEAQQTPSRGDPPPYFSYHQVLKVTPAEQQQQQHVPEQQQIQQLTPQSPLGSNMLQLQAQTPSQPQIQHPNHISSNCQQIQAQTTIQAQVQNPNHIPANCQQSHSSVPPTTAVQPNSPPLPRPVVVCQRPHPPNVFCRTCLNVRRSHRQNAAAFVRRANSSGCQHNRRSAPSPASSGDSLDDAPSILERLKKEWELGFLGPPSNKGGTMSFGDSKADGFKTLPQPLGGNVCDNKKKEKDQAPQAEVFSTKHLNEPLSDPNENVKEKKDVSHLDRALNRLSIKRSSSQPGQKHFVRTIKSEGPQSPTKLNSDIPGPDKNVEPLTADPSQVSNIAFSVIQNSNSLDVSLNAPDQNIHTLGMTMQPPQYGLSSNQTPPNTNPGNRSEHIELLILEDADHFKRKRSNRTQSFNIKKLS